MKNYKHPYPLAQENFYEEKRTVQQRCDDAMDLHVQRTTREPFQNWEPFTDACERDQRVRRALTRTINSTTSGEAAPTLGNTNQFDNQGVN